MAAAIDKNQQVPLDTIPISPDGDMTNSAEISDTNGEQITVFHDRDNFNVKHPLMHKWTLWFTKPPSGKVSITHSDYVLKSP
jgi:translation initiation factor 4E